MAQIAQGHWKLLFPSRFISSADLKEKDVTILVDRVERDNLKMSGGKSEQKLVLYMRTVAGKRLTKGLVLNKTNATTIASLHGNKIEDWSGRPITLYPTTTKFGPTTVDCVRIRARPGKGGGTVPDEMAAEPDPEPEDGTLADEADAEQKPAGREPGSDDR